MSIAEAPGGGGVPVGTLAAGLAAAGCCGLLGLLLLIAMVGQSQAPATDLPGGTGLNTSAIPKRQYVPWVIEAGSRCDVITPPVIAAQIEQESGWDPNADSGKAKGLTQFTPSTWATWGHGDPTDPKAAIDAQSRYDCALAGQMTKLKKAGRVDGDTLDLTLAAYNAGPAAVAAAGGIPPYPETQTYVDRIDKGIAKYTAPTGAAAGSGAGKRAVAAAKTALGTSYVFGGTCTDPHGSNLSAHCDCSSLMQMAWATSGVNLPRTTFDQVKTGTAVHDFKRLRPGDLLFTAGSDGTAANPGHVGMYMGGGRLIQAPHTGDVVKISPLSEWQPEIVAMRHIK